MERGLLLMGLLTGLSAFNIDVLKKNVVELKGDNVRSFSDYSIFTSSILVSGMLKETSASRRFIWCNLLRLVPYNKLSHVTMRQSIAGIICCTALVANVACTYLYPLLD